MPFLWARAQLAASTANVGSLVMPPILVSPIKPSRHQICAGMSCLISLGALGELSCRLTGENLVAIPFFAFLY